MIIENRGGFKEHAKIILLYIGLGLVDYIVTGHFISDIMKAEGIDKRESHTVHTMILFAFEVYRIFL